MGPHIRFQVNYMNIQKLSINCIYTVTVLHVTKPFFFSIEHIWICMVTVIYWVTKIGRLLANADIVNGKLEALIRELFSAASQPAVKIVYSFQCSERLILEVYTGCVGSA